MHHSAMNMAVLGLFVKKEMVHCGTYHQLAIDVWYGRWIEHT